MDDGTNLETRSIFLQNLSTIVYLRTDYSTASSSAPASDPSKPELTTSSASQRDLVKVGPVTLFASQQDLMTALYGSPSRNQPFAHGFHGQSSGSPSERAVTPASDGFFGCRPLTEYRFSTPTEKMPAQAHPSLIASNSNMLTSELSQSQIEAMLSANTVLGLATSSSITLFHQHAWDSRAALYHYLSTDEVRGTTASVQGHQPPSASAPDSTPTYPTSVQSHQLPFTSAPDNTSTYPASV